MYPAPRSITSYALQSLVSYLDKEYCQPMLQLSSNVRQCAAGISEGERAERGVIRLERKLAQLAADYVELRRRAFSVFSEEALSQSSHLPLSKKTFSGLEARHIKLLETIAALQEKIAAAPEGQSGPAEIKRLRQLAQRLEEMLSEFLFLEQTVLFPRIRLWESDLQKSA